MRGESGETVRLGLTTSGALTLQGAPLFEEARIPARVRGTYAEYAFSQRSDGTITANVATRPPLRVSTTTAESGGDLIEAIAGTGEEGYSGVGWQATHAQFDTPRGVAVDSHGNSLVAGEGDHRVRRIDAVSGLIEAVAGTGERVFSGDGGPASEAQLDGPFGLAANANGNLFVTELSGRVRRISASPDRVGAQLGSSGEERTFSSSADGIVTYGREASASR